MAVVEDSFSYIQLGRKNRKKKELCNKRPSQKKTIHVNQQLFSNMIHICIRPCHAEQCMHYSKHQDKSQVWLSKFQKTLARLFFSYDCDLLLLLYCTIVSLLMAFSFCHCQLLYLKSIQLWTIYEHYEAFLFCTDSYRFKPAFILRKSNAFCLQHQIHSHIFHFILIISIPYYAYLI